MIADIPADPSRTFFDVKDCILASFGLTPTAVAVCFDELKAKDFEGKSTAQVLQQIFGPSD